MPFKDFLSGALVALLFIRAELLCNFGHGHYEERFFDISGSGGNVI